MKCEFCSNEFSNKQNLNAHQKKAKYCLKIQGVKGQEFSCGYCTKIFHSKYDHKRHTTTCKQTSSVNHLKEVILEQNSRIDKLEERCKMLQADKKDLQERYDKLSITAVKRPTTSTKNVQINNYIKNMAPLLESDLTSNVENLTLDYHVKGIEGYAEYALEFPFKDKIVCVDTTRNKIKYKNEDGDLIEDIGFKKMMVKLCRALKDRSFSLSQEHYEKLADNFSDSEMDEVNFMETAMAITKCANGKENEFCDKIVNMISKGSKM